MPKISRSRALLVPVILSLTLTSCSTYDVPGGTRIGDPSICSSVRGFCPLLIVGALAGVIVAASSGH